MVTLAESLKPTLHSARAVAGRLGFRPFRVYAVLNTWDGSTTGAGYGSRTETLTELKHADGQPPKVRFLKGKEVLRGELAQGSIEIGPLTPNFGAGGVDYDTLFTRTDGQTAKIKITGPGTGSGEYYAIKEVDQEKALRIMIIAEPVSQTP